LDPNNLVANATFDGSISVPWTSSFTAPGGGNASVENGEYCLLVTNQGKNPWDAQVRHREMTIRKEHSYSVTFDVRASRPTKIRAKVGMAGPPYAEYWHDEIALTTDRQTYRGEFKMGADDDPTAELAVHAGGPLASAPVPFTICIDNVKLVDPQFRRTDEAKSAPLADVRVNQLGYLPDLPKRATVRSDATAPVEWELRNEAGARVASGKTSVFGYDAASGERVHVVDFSSFRTPGKRYVLRVRDGASHPFDIAPDLYRRAKYDALAYFYQNRSGIAITMPYAGGEAWTRPAGHESDASVPCAPGSGCSYSLDVRGGWYDAGDHGKYVVNGGIAVWTLLNLYERTQGTALADFGDGKLLVPERGNGVPDLLDEARWEIEFLLRMQVPDGAPRAGMVHHKIHDKEWTALGTAPHEDKIERLLYPPSTAATLNLAAVAAQAARVFHSFDPAFAARCLLSAEKAWSAAQANPQVYAPASPSVGGGPYDDTNVGDEFYWAASELFVTTGKKVYQEYLQRSLSYASVKGPMSWQSTEALGTISLALVPNHLPPSQVAAMRKTLQVAADDIVATMSKQGYGVPLRPGPYVWGSNSLVANDMLLVALAYDFTRDERYLGAVAEGVDYLFGRNPLDRSYVTGYGARPVENPHHRFWAHQANPKYPRPPAGALAGGPNSGLQDPYAQGAGLSGCAPEKCYADHAESWSTNEVAINWNAPFAWVLAFLDDASRVPKSNVKR
jgi:endoglucanase